MVNFGGGFHGQVSVVNPSTGPEGEAAQASLPETSQRALDSMSTLTFTKHHQNHTALDSLTPNP